MTLAPVAVPGDLTVPTRTGPSYFLALSSIPGSSTVASFEHQIPVLTWGWGVDATGTVVVGAGATSGTATPQDVVVRAESGIHSSRVLAAVNTGERLERAVLSCVPPGERTSAFLTLTFEDVLLSGYYVTPEGHAGTPVDQLRFKFAKVTQQVFTDGSDGMAGEPISSSFDYRSGNPV